VHLDFNPLFNSTVGDSGPSLVAPPAALATSRILQTRPMPPTPALIRFDLHHVDDALGMSLWSGDTGRLTVDDAETLLAAVERILGAAASGDIVAARIGETTGVDPIPRGPQWVLVDSDWVELAEVQRVLDAAVGAGNGRVFAEPDGDLVVGYVVAGEAVRSPTEVHRRCLAAVRGRHTAITPRRYVMCAADPADPADRADPASWRAVQLTSGTGRRGGSSRPVPVDVPAEVPGSLPAHGHA
jgi:hypothetical protein